MLIINCSIIGFKKDQQLIELQDNTVNRQQQQQIQMEEEQNFRELQEQEQAIEVLEVHEFISGDFHTKICIFRATSMM